MFVKKFKEMLIFMNIKAMILLKFIENTIILILAIHISACLWMFVTRNESDGFIFFLQKLYFLIIERIFS